MLLKNTYTRVSHNIQVSVRPAYLEDRSDPISGKHVFIYFIRIKNQRAGEVQLLNRHWEIEDSSGDSYDVDGEGVIGKKPKIESGGEFEYNSSCVLNSYKGRMKGYYIMKLESGERIKVNIPEFELISHKLN